MINQLKYQISAILVIMILLVKYLKNRKLPLLSTKFFSVFLFTSIVNLVADLCTIYGLSNYWSISPFLLRLFHQVFVGSLDVLTFSLYLYICFLDNGQKRFEIKQLIPRISPLVIAVIMVVVAPLDYHISSTAKYSYGPMANTVYISVAIYVSLIFIRVNRKGNLTKEVKRSINLGLLIWVVVAVYQFFNPTALMSSLGVMSMVLFIYLSFENPKEYYDIETGKMNRRAFHLVVDEFMEGKKNFYMVSIILKDMNHIQNLLGHAEAYDVLCEMACTIDDFTKDRIYHSRSDTLSIIFKRKAKADKFVNKLQDIKFEYLAKDIVMYPKFLVNVIECPQYAQSSDGLYKVLDYVREEYIMDEKNEVLYVGEHLINQIRYNDTVEKMIEEAVLNDGFEVFYQPIYDVKNKSFSSAEALVRLKDTKTLGFISPEVFIPIAEEKGLIKELGRIVFEKVCIFSKNNNLSKKGIRYIEVNISGMQGTDKDLVKELNDCIMKYKILPGFINLEITETAATEAGQDLKNNMRKLINLGFSFSLDDFGTGYSNLAKMMEGNYHLIKLDKSLIWPCFDKDGENAQVILDNCINMILSLGMGIVAEGVETKEQVEYLTEKGVNYLQGYFYSKPINEQDYLTFIEKQ